MFVFISAAVENSIYLSTNTMGFHKSCMFCFPFHHWYNKYIFSWSVEI